MLISLNNGKTLGGGGGGGRVTNHEFELKWCCFLRSPKGAELSGFLRERSFVNLAMIKSAGRASARVQNAADEYTLS